MQLMLQVLAEGNQREIVEFCKEEGLVLLADEVSSYLFWLVHQLFDRTGTESYQDQVCDFERFIHYLTAWNSTLSILGYDSRVDERLLGSKICGQIVIHEFSFDKNRI